MFKAESGEEAMRWRTGVVVVVLVVVCDSALTASANAQQVLLATNLCAVWASPSQFNEREIVVTVQFESDGIHTTSLFDRKYADKGATPKFSRMAANNPDLQALQKALNTGTFYSNPTPDVRHP